MKNLSIKKAKNISLAIVIGFTMLFSQKSINASGFNDKWALQYGSDQIDSIGTTIKTDDGGYISVGSTYGNVGQSTSFGKADGWILKVSSEGTIEWSKQYGGTENDYFSSIAQTSDGGYIVSGSTEGSVDGNTSHGDVDGWILKISENGTTEWSKQYGSSSYDTLASIQVASDGGYIATGTTLGTLGTATSFGYFDGYVLKVSSDGSVQWVKQYGTPAQDSLSNIQSTSDGGYIVAGHTQGIVSNGSNFGIIDGWLLKISSDGSEQWSKQYGTSVEDLFRAVRQTNDGGFVAAGYLSTTYGSTDGWILKTDSNGVQEWSKWYGDAQYEFLSSIELTDDGGYVAVGQSYRSSQYDAWLLKISEGGFMEWSQFFGSDKSDGFNSVIPISDGGYIVSGYTSGSINGSVNSGLNDGLIMKLNTVYNLDFDLNGALGDAPLTQTLEKGSLAIKPDSPAKENFVFDGWNTAQDGSGIDWNFSSTAMPANDLILYAQWKEVFQLQFNLNGGDGLAPNSQSLVEGAFANIVIEPTREGYTLKEWNTAQDGSGVSWNFNSSTMPANNVVLFAQWEKNVDPIIEFTLSFDLNGGTGLAPTNQQLKEGAKADKPVNPTRDGYAFKEWNTAQDGSGVSWNFNSSTMPANNIVLFAQWEKNVDPIIEFTLSFDLNGGTGLAPTNQHLKEGAKADETVNPTRDGYTFKEWNTVKDGSGLSWNFNSSTMPANNVVLFAQWEKNVDPIIEFTLSFDLNGGTGLAPANQHLKEGAKADNPITPTRDGYTFKEWNTVKDGTGNPWNFNSTTMTANDITLYAQWTKNNLPKTGDSNNVIVFSTLSVFSGMILVFANKKRYSK